MSKPVEKPIKEQYKEAFNAAVDELRKNGFDSLWKDEQCITDARAEICLEPGNVVYVKYEKNAITFPPKVVPISPSKEEE